MDVLFGLALGSFFVCYGTILAIVLDRALRPPILLMPRFPPPPRPPWTTDGKDTAV